MSNEETHRVYFEVPNEKVAKEIYVQMSNEFPTSEKIQKISYEKKKRPEQEINWYSRYKEEIDAFMNGEYVYHNDSEKGHVWIARHPKCHSDENRTYVQENFTEFETLTVEPPEGG